MATIGTTNVTMASIRDALNAAGGSVGNDLTTFFRSNSGINSSAKYKSVILPYNFLDIDSAPTIYGLWWKGTDGKSGFTMPSVANYITGQNDDAGWTYNIPNGGANTPMRLGDFRKHDTNAAHNWLGINLPPRIVIGQEFSYSINPTKTNESSLSYYETVDELWLNFKAMSSTNNGYDYQIPLASAQSSPGRLIVNIAATEVNKWGAVAGTTVRVHLFAKKNGVVVSARNHPSVSTFWTIPVLSVEPYALSLMVGDLVRDITNPYVLYIYSVRAIVDATRYAGGTIESGSRLMLFQYVNDDYNYISYMTPLWSTTFGAINVSAGNTWQQTFGVPSITVNHNISNLTKCMFVWYNNQNQPIYKLAYDVREGYKPM